MARRSRWYVVDEDWTVRPATDRIAAAKCIGTRVAFTDIGRNGKAVSVSTVFLALNHQWGDGPPLLFETMIFHGEFDREMWRCSTYDEAVKQHETACMIARGEITMFRRGR